MYTYILLIHSWVRWIILILAVVNIYNSFQGWKGNRPYTKTDDQFAKYFVSATHLQGTLGLLLYFFFSPFAFNSFSGDTPVMANDTLRFWSVEHVSAMFVGIVLITLGRIKAKKEIADQVKYKKQFIYFTIAIFIILSAIPFQEAGRLFRF